MITYSLADNQILGNECFDKMNMAISCGDLRLIDDPVSAVFDKVQGGLKKMSNNDLIRVCLLMIFLCVDPGGKFILKTKNGFNVSYP